MRAVIYARYSTDNQNPRSVDDQVRDCRAAAAAADAVVVDVFSDAAISGATMLRPGIQSVLAAAAAGRCDLVIAEALDRISRDLGDTAQIYKLLGFHQVRLHTLSEGDVTPLHVGFKGVINSQFLADLALKVRRGQRGVAARGLAPGGISYGYEVVKEIGADGELARGRRRIREDQAAIVRRIFAEYAAGRTPYQISADLNRERVPTQFGGAWRISTITGHAARRNGILQNELYIGRLIYNRVAMVKNPTTGKRISRPNPPAAWQVTEAPQLRIVSDDLWNQAQAEIERNRTRARGTPNRRPRVDHMLSGVAFCKVCGGPYTAKDKKKLGCRNHMNGATCDNPVRVHRAPLEARVLDEIRAFLEHPAAVAAFTRKFNEEIRRRGADRHGRRRQALKELQDVKGKIARILEAIEDGAGGRTTAARLVELEARQAQLESEIAEAEAGPVEVLPQAAEIYARQIAGLQAALAGAKPADQAAAFAKIRSIVTRVEIAPAKADGEIEVAVIAATGEFLAAQKGKAAAGIPDGRLSEMGADTTQNNQGTPLGVLRGSGGGTRTPDPRIMIPVL